ncbi:hypothetical protein JQX13_16270 [Archangium violaceum]|uniref:hypothetical protein n=1 Tax=Archangium violaceum TaxID=83451 RepID=UPI00193C045C|nr:hypothetical protein [Archangium violaceum]QRK11487.1 hypothetical protein JQX13_16270 [Archangium violaceum]
MRWVYGPTLGALYAWLRPALPSTVRLRGLSLGGAVWLLERLTFPVLRVTRPPRTWSPTERRLLVLQTLVFGFFTEAVLSRGQADSPGSAHPLRVGRGRPASPI